LHKKLSKFGSKSYNLIDTLDYIATRNKWWATIIF
jgi:hypothetical protein